jgi:GDP-4-dehydro-6-deoxy-D-mannose reductase
MRVMITGAAGFIGTYLANYSSGLGATVLGIGITEPGADWAGGAFEHCDVRDYPRLKQLLATFKPDRIFHLAAQSYPTRSLRDPQETFTVNVGGTINLFEGLRALASKPLVVVACSSAEYGNVAPSDLPVREDHLLQPLHPYGVSKVAQDLLAAQYFFNYSIPTLRIRIFNTTGPGKIEDLCSDLTRRAAEIELGLRPPKMPAGNLSTRRAIVDVRDLVRGLWMASEHCAEGEAYNLGGNSIYSVQEVIDAIRAEVNIPFIVERDPALVRKCDEPVIAGDTTKIRNCSGWTPEIELSRTLREMLHWWRSRLSAKSSSSFSRESRTHDLLV